MLLTRPDPRAQMTRAHQPNPSLSARNVDPPKLPARCRTTAAVGVSLRSVAM
jgi:hypothetical protein